MAAQVPGAAGETFGVIWATARAEVDRVASRVTLEELSLTRSNFPTLAQSSFSQGGGWGSHFSGGGFGGRFGGGGGFRR